MIQGIRETVQRHLYARGYERRKVNRFNFAQKLRVLRELGEQPADHLGWLLTSSELDNFTYELENEDELAAWLAATFGADHARVCQLLIEARSNPAIYRPLHDATRPWWVRSDPPLGRRLGWYAMIRLLKPQRVAETGIHDGIGSLVLLSALDANAAEGDEGTLVSFDIDPTAGWIVDKHPRWSPRFGDSRETLPDALAEHPVDVFIHDSLHTPEHERYEFDEAIKHMAPGGVLLSDNSHATSVLREFSEDHGRQYTYWQERPRDHFYAGAGIGVSLPS